MTRDLEKAELGGLLFPAERGRKPLNTVTRKSGKVGKFRLYFTSKTQTFKECDFRGYQPVPGGVLIVGKLKRKE